MLQLFSHPFSSYCWKTLIPLYADEIPFEYRFVEEPENMEELKRHWPFGKFPLLLDEDLAVIESTPLIEHLQGRGYASTEWIPSGDLGRRVRFLDRFFDNYVMFNMTKIATDPLRPEESRDSYGVERARDDLRTAYDWLEPQLGDAWGVGDRFTLVDCAAAPSLFYADWVEEIGSTRPNLKSYRARLLAHPAVARCVDEARPYRAYFPPGAPDRD